jgi:cytochrome c oxidase assembly protein subunit 15
MAHVNPNKNGTIHSTHRNLLLTGAIFTTLLIAMGGILCVTQSIRNCPDWPGCFGSFIPPAETGSILEYTHRFLAGVSSLLILSSAVVGLVQVPRIRWVSIPPLVALALLVEVSFFGAQVVLRGLSPGWAAVDVGSALMVVALMVTAAVKANIVVNSDSQPEKHGESKNFTRLAMASAAAVYVVFVSGILVAGKGSITSCLGWPIYNLQQLQMDGLTVVNILRLALSIVGAGLLLVMLAQAWRSRREQAGIFKIARWVGLVIILEALVQVLLQAFGLLVPLMAAYTLTAAALWALLVGLAVRSSQPTA